MRHSNTEPKSNPPQRQLPHPLAEIVSDWDEVFQQMEIDGCPPDTAARIRREFEVALTETLEEFEWRAFLFREIRQNLGALSSSPPARALEILDEIDELVSRLPDVDERQDVMRLIGLLGPLRKGFEGSQS